MGTETRPPVGNPHKLIDWTVSSTGEVESVTFARLGVRIGHPIYKTTDTISGIRTTVDASHMDKALLRAVQDACMECTSYVDFPHSECPDYRVLLSDEHGRLAPA